MAGKIVTFATIDEHEITEPQATPSHERAIVFDGRLSNVQDIQNELDLHRLNGDKDAEIVLHYFEESGTSIFGKMEGEFALALVDGDRMGLPGVQASSPLT